MSANKRAGISGGSGAKRGDIKALSSESVHSDTKQILSEMQKHGALKLSYAKCLRVLFHTGLHPVICCVAAVGLIGGAITDGKVSTALLSAGAGAVGALLNSYKKSP